LALYAGCVEEGEYTSCTGKMFLNIAVVFLWIVVSYLVDSTKYKELEDAQEKCFSTLL
jgi:hypothetical protein